MQVAFPATPAAALYWACFLLLPVAAVFVLHKGPRSPLHRRFSLLAVSLLAWLVTLYAFNRSVEPETVLWLGRLNFAAITFATLYAYLFVEALARQAVVLSGTPDRAFTATAAWMLAETLLLAALTAFTPLVDRAELVAHSAGLSPAASAVSVVHATVYGPLFVLYLLHSVGYVAAAVYAAFSAARRAPHPERDQLLLVGLGTLTTGSIALVTNALLPYAFGNFRYVDVGTLSSVALLLAVGWAVARHRLFDVRLLIRKTLVLGLLLFIVAAVYSALVALVTERLAADSANAWIKFGVLVIASSIDPLRRFLDDKVVHLIFGRGEGKKHKASAHR